LKTDLFPDIKSLIFHAERGAWYVECIRFVVKDVMVDDALKIKGDYNDIYLPLTLKQCLILHECKVFDAHIPTWNDDMEVQLQHISISGKDFDMISMDEYSELAKTETVIQTSKDKNTKNN
jgi:hypothetical protein